MKIAIISDTHDNLVNIQKAIAWMKQNDIKVIIHCGDACAPLTLREISKAFEGPIHFVFGNVDGEEYLITKRVYAGETANISLYKNIGELELNGKKIAITHYPQTAQALARTGDYDLVFYGHSHEPWEEKIGKTQLVNPGTLAGLFTKATFAVYDFDNDQLTLKMIEHI